MCRKMILSISIHVLRVEDDGVDAERGAELEHFNPRPPCGGRLGVAEDYTNKPSISIHVLRVEDDSKNREKSLFAFIIIQQFVQICN